MRSLGILFFISFIFFDLDVAWCQFKMIEGARIRKMRRHDVNEVVLKFNNGEEAHAWVSHGGKPKLLLLHGITGNGLVQYGKNATKLSKYYDVVILDLRFHGQSKNLAQGYKIQDQAHWVSESLIMISQLYHDEGFEKVHVLGNSYGGIVAGVFADMFPNMVNELTMVDAPVRYFSSAMADSVARSVGLQDFFDLLSPQSAEIFKARTKLSLHRKIWIPNGVARSIIENDLKPQRENHRLLVSSLKEDEKFWADHTFQWKCVVNIFWGQADRLIPLDVGKRQAAHFKNAHYKELPKVGHVWNMERAKQFNHWLIKNQNRIRTISTPSF